MTGERGDPRFRQRFRGLWACRLDPNGESGLRPFEIALKLPKRAGRPSHPFKAYTLPIDGADYGARRRENIIAQSRMLYGRPRERVERSVARVLSPLALTTLVRRERTRPDPERPQGQEHQARTAKRCTACNEAGYLELRHAESGELLVHRCPHQPELVARIEERLKAYRIGGGKRAKAVV